MRVLVADDSPVHRELAVAMLRKLGHEAVTVSDGPSAVEAASGGGFDVVIVDVQMPGMDGLEAARQIRARLPAARRPRIVALSAAPIEGRQAGSVDAQLPKPLDLGTLARELGGEQPSSEHAHAAGALRSLRAQIGDDAAAAVVNRLAEDLPAAREALLRAATSGDREGLGAAAHRAAGLAGLLGAAGLAEACRLLDGAESVGQIGEILAALDELGAEVARGRDGRGPPSG